jgi:hypothetical protein
MAMRRRCRSMRDPSSDCKDGVVEAILHEENEGSFTVVKWFLCRVLRDVIPPTPPGPEGSNGNG